MTSERGTATQVGLVLAPGADPGVRYRLRQSFRYDYDGPVRDLQHRLVVVPPVQHGDQRLLLGAVQVSDPDATAAFGVDPDGNRPCVVRLAAVPSTLHLQVEVVVTRGGAAPSLPLELLHSPRTRAPSALTRPDARLRRLAAEHGRGSDVLAAADRLCALVHELVRYEYGTTSVSTTAAQALAGGVGVCQDQAHVMLALARAAGIPARYVSGHLVGQGGTHAWVEVLVREGRHGRAARAVAFDPCHARRADRRYVTVAVGRDYRDVPPTSGWYSGPWRGRLTTERLLTCEPLVAA
jgi:transglutaminase-like putative cysteine protease